MEGGRRRNAFGTSFETLRHFPSGSMSFPSPLSSLPFLYPHLEIVSLDSLSCIAVWVRAASPGAVSCQLSKGSCFMLFLVQLDCSPSLNFRLENLIISLVLNVNNSTFHDIILFKMKDTTGSKIASMENKFFVMKLIVLAVFGHFSVFHIYGIKFLV